MQKKLLQKLNCTKESECTSLKYRGNGWPGYATVKKKNGEVNQISYSESWGKILGRHTRKSCRFCIDGIGEWADIACGDAWYQNEDGTPDFTEKDGRNIIFARSEIGEKILDGAYKKKYIEIEENSEYNRTLHKIQKFQYERRCTMRAMVLAMKLMRKKVPNYDTRKLKGLEKRISFKIRLRRFLGIVKRCLQGKI